MTATPLAIFIAVDSETEASRNKQKFTSWLRTQLVTSAALLFVLPGVAGADPYDAGTLDFASDGQSMWDAGAAFRKEEAVFLGTQWTDKTATFGSIAGGVESVPNPLWLAWFLCPFDCGSEPSKTTSIDTRTGATVALTSTGKIGLEFGYTIDSGSVDSTVSYSALADLPDTVAAMDFIDLNTASTLDAGTLATQSPKLEAYISAIMKLSGSIKTKACALLIGCPGIAQTTVNLPTINLDQRIISADINSIKFLDGLLPGGEPLAQIPIANQTFTLEGGLTPVPPAVGFKVTGPFGASIINTLPPTPAVTVDLAEIEVQVPDIATSGGKLPAADKLTSSGRDDVLSMTLDLDGAATLLAGLPPAGANFTLVDIPGIKISASLDFIDVDAGPVMGMTQDFELIPTLMVDLVFDNPVHLAGLSGPQSSWTGKWADLPDVALLTTTTFSPTFWIDVLFKNTSGIDLGLAGTIDILKLGATGTAAGVELIDFGPLSLTGLLGLDNTLFETPKFGIPIFSKTFGLGGFDKIAGTPFTLSLASGGGGGGTVPPATSVPEPGTFWLLLIGLAAVGFTRRRGMSFMPMEYAH